MKRFILILLLPLATSAFFSSEIFRSTLHVKPALLSKIPSDSQGDDSSAEDIHYPTRQPYVDRTTGRLSVDVGDLGLSMEDLGSIFNTPEMVHPAPGEEGGLNSNKYVRDDGTIDWDAMAADL